MNRYLYLTVFSALALTLGGATAALAHAQDANMGVGVSANVQVGSTTSVGASTTVQGQVRGGDGGTQAREHAQAREAVQQEHRMGGTATGTVRARMEVGDHASESAREHSRAALFLDLGTTTPVFSVAELKAQIAEHRAQFQAELASTSPTERKSLEHASEVSIAVHALLSARGLLGGGIGDQVSQIATQVNDSLASTTGAQMQIAARGFWTNLFFGGDAKAAKVLEKTTAENQARIQQLTGLLNQASTSADVKAQLQTQVQTMEQAQTALAAQAKAQAGLWGLFSWRLF